MEFFVVATSKLLTLLLLGSVLLMASSVFPLELPWFKYYNFLGITE